MDYLYDVALSKFDAVEFIFLLNNVFFLRILNINSDYEDVGILFGVVKSMKIWTRKIFGQSYILRSMVWNLYCKFIAS